MTTTKGKNMKITAGDIVKVSNAHLGLGPHFLQVTDLDADRDGTVSGFVVVPNGRGDFVTAISSRDGRRCGAWARVGQVVEVNPDATAAAAECPELVDARTDDERRAARRAALKADRAARRAAAKAAAARRAEPSPYLDPFVLALLLNDNADNGQN